MDFYFLTSSFCLFRHMVCPSLSPASGRNPAFMEYMALDHPPPPAPRFRAGSGSQEIRARENGWRLFLRLLPAGLPGCWVPLRVHGAPCRAGALPGVQGQPLTFAFRPAGANGFPLTVPWALCQPCPRLGDAPSLTCLQLALRFPASPSGTGQSSGTGPAPLLYLRWQPALQARESSRCTSCREAGSR